MSGAPDRLADRGGSRPAGYATGDRYGTEIFHSGAATPGETNRRDG